MENLQINISVPAGHIEEYFDNILQYSLNLELYLGFDTAVSPKELDLIKKIAEYSGRDRMLTFHGPFYNLFPGSNDSLMRKNILERFEDTFKLASILPPRQIVLHPAYNKKDTGENLKKWIDNSLPLWSFAYEKAKQTNTRIALENTTEESPEPLKMLLEHLPPDPNIFGVCLDLGHINLIKNTRWESWFEALGSRIFELHIHDNFGLSDDHMAAGDGAINFENALRLLNKYCRNSVVLTIENRSLPAILRSVEKIKSLISAL